MTRGVTGSRPLRVLESINPPDGTTQYVDQIVELAPPWVRFSFLGAKSLASLRYDVLHVHWPESLLRGRSHVLRCLAFVALLEVLRLRRIAVVRTLHNLQPHEDGSRLEAAVLRWLDRRTTFTVTINPVTPIPAGRGVYIPHGHYRERFTALPHQTPVAGRLLYAGTIRPYKGVDVLLDAFRALDDPALTLRLVGQPSREMRPLVDRMRSDDGRISATLAFVPDALLVAEITAAQLVCLPYRQLHNSGVLLAALSLDRPVLVPRTPTTEAMAQEVGPGWIHFFDGVLQAQDLRQVMAKVQTESRPERPRLDGRDWRVVGQAYADAFAQAAALVGRAPVARLAPDGRGGER